MIKLNTTMGRNYSLSELSATCARARLLAVVRNGDDRNQSVDDAQSEHRATSEDAFRVEPSRDEAYQEASYSLASIMESSSLLSDMRTFMSQPSEKAASFTAPGVSAKLSLTSMTSPETGE